MKLACISDTHGKHREITSMPEADVLVVAGDITNRGELGMLNDFNEWLGELPYKNKIVTFGNHEVNTEKLALAGKKEIFNNAHYLENSEINVDKIKFWASPYSSYFFGQYWAWNMPEFDYEEGYPFAKKLWGFIPDDTNILIVHGPAYGILDECPDGARVGCPVLLERINELKSLGHLKAVITGHIHHAAGREVHDGIQFVNAAICDEQYKAVNPVITIEIN